MLRESDILSLHPVMREPVSLMIKDLEKAFTSGATLSNFKLFETYRSPSRQDKVFKDGASKARAWQSAHQFGLAADFAAVTVTGSWNWDDAHDWNFLRQIAMKHGLRVPIAWDKGHVEHPDFDYMKMIVRQGGKK